jgi:hypothetical protein
MLSRIHIGAVDHEAVGGVARLRAADAEEHVLDQCGVGRAGSLLRREPPTCSSTGEW